MSDTTENMTLWDSVCKTDPAMTKHVDQKGGFTAIDAQGQLRRATEVWGPYGIHWGVRDCVYGVVQSANGEVIECYLEAHFFYPNGSFLMSTDIAFRKGNDTRKKLLTDLTTKALSKLGFNSDVFEGKFDDDKYVSERRREVAAEKATEKKGHDGGDPPLDIQKVKIECNRHRERLNWDTEPFVQALEQRYEKRRGELTVENYQDAATWLATLDTIPEKSYETGPHAQRSE